MPCFLAKHLGPLQLLLYLLMLQLPKFSAHLAEWLAERLKQQHTVVVVSGRRGGVGACVEFVGSGGDTEGARKFGKVWWIGSMCLRPKQANSWLGSLGR